MRTNNIEVNILGQTIQGQSWGDSSKPVILALHGWLDNSNSFNWLAEHLSEQFNFIAIDLPGHGHSAHLPESSHYHFIDCLFLLPQIVSKLGLKRIHLMGHSLGACITSMAAGLMMGNLESLVLIEAIGPMTASENDAFAQLSDYVKEYPTLAKRKPRIIPDLDTAAKARSLNGLVSYEIAYQLCKRGTEKVKDGYRWRHDPRLNAKSPLKLTESQALDCLKEIKAPTLLITGTEGFGCDSRRWQSRVDCVETIKVEQLKGGHHVHMERPEACARLISDFISRL